MLKNLLLTILLSLIFTIISGILVLPLLRKFKAGQTILNYVAEHREKNGTPTLGGLFFIIPAVIVFCIFFGFNRRSSAVALSIGLAYLIVGFIDDFIKIKFRKNEGLKAYQKILFQLTIAVFSGLFCYLNGITTLYLPFSNKTIEVGLLIIPLSTFIFLAITNGVNLTDGLDSLASGVSFFYLLFLIMLIYAENFLLSTNYINQEESKGLILLSSSLMGGILGFLAFNVPKAKVFMGDTGSLSLGGFLGAISIFSSNSLFIPLLGIAFVISCLSVIIQVLYFKKTKGKRIFLMSPYHHHLQMKGYTETQISYFYSLLTCIMGLTLVIFYL